MWGVHAVVAIEGMNEPPMHPSDELQFTLKPV